MNEMKYQSKQKSASLRIRQLVIVALFLSLAILVSFVTNFIRLPFFGAASLTLDLSSIFLIALLLVVGYWWSLFAGITLGAFSLLWSFDVTLWIGGLFNIITNVVLVSVISFLSKMPFFSKKNLWLKWSLIFSISTIILTLVFTLINGILFTPLFWNFFEVQGVDSINFIQISEDYNQGLLPAAEIFLFTIKNYWAGIFAIFGSFNILKYSIVFFISLPVIISLIKSNLIENYFLKNVSYS